ncbi:putative virion structural protein [Serratia phage vB_SmaS_Opt-155]|uniref:Virion structural protein n=1 Tax=Serratia phage vB_SmaS_Opt-155 TaxID=2902690 RepID=A0AC61TPY7_9CAUD|nr:putative virion structural protein [Serratia phage vB_SmaS_Opt-155]UGO52721.1 putative virion structural protein [Serratia phage vB_SmaS_Opt-155]
MIIVEDGSGVANANSYVSLEQTKQYALSRGLTLPDADPDIESLMHQAVDYLQYNYQYRGEKTYPDAELEFPRTGIKGYAPDQIPSRIKNAQMQLTALAYEHDLSPVTSSGVVREKVDVIEVQYSDGGDTGPFQSDMIDNMMSPFTQSTSVGLLQQARVVRA